MQGAPSVDTKRVIAVIGTTAFRGVCKQNHQWWFFIVHDKCKYNEAFSFFPNPAERKRSELLCSARIIEEMCCITQSLFSLEQRTKCDSNESAFAFHEMLSVGN